jgi:hypothetical protein
VGAIPGGRRRAHQHRGVKGPEPEDAYAKHRHWHKLTYKDDELENAVEQAAAWAEKFVGEFGNYQAMKLPWLKKK